MTLHKAHLNQYPFELIESGNKTIEARLYDERRQRIDIGDEIEFINRSNNKTLHVKVHRLHRAPTFHDLFMAHDPLKFGGETADGLERAIEKFYDYDAQQKHGVLGIEFVLVKKSVK